jgi:hypothetical protein
MGEIRDKENMIMNNIFMEGVTHGNRVIGMVIVAYGRLVLLAGNMGA